MVIANTLLSFSNHLPMYGGLDVEKFTPLLFLSNIDIPWVLVDHGGISQVSVRMEDGKGLASDYLPFFLKQYQGE